MVVMVSLALAGEDVGAIEAALVGFDATIAEGRAWVASEAHDPAVGKTIREKLEAEANELRPLTRKLEIAYGESMSTKKHVGLEAVEAARAHMEAQRAARREVGALIDGTLALGVAASAPERWVDVEGQYVGVARKWTGGPPDDWLIPSIAAAAKAERWAYVLGASGWCELVCTSKDGLAALVTAAPEGSAADPRWNVAINAAKAAATPE